MKTVPLQEARIHLSRLIQEVIAGEEILISCDGQSLVRLEPISFHREFGTVRGMIRMSEDFDEPLDDFRTYS